MLPVDDGRYPLSYFSGCLLFVLWLLQGSRERSPPVGWYRSLLSGPIRKISLSVVDAVLWVAIFVEMIRVVPCARWEFAPPDIQLGRLT